MSDSNTTTLDDATDSPSIDLGNENEYAPLDDNSFDVLVGGLMNETFGHTEPESAKEVLQDSEEEPEEESSEDDAPVEADEETEDTDEVSEEEADEDNQDDGSEELPVFDYDDVKQGLIPVKVGGEIRNMSITQIQSELGQVKAASKSQGEVKAQLEDIETQKKQIEERQAVLEEQAKAVQETQQLAQRQNRIDHLNANLAKAREAQDVNAMTLIRDAIEQEKTLFDEERAHVKKVQEDTRAANLKLQQDILNDKGYGSILSDEQRMGHLRSYASENLSPAAQNIVSDDATLFIALEKARLWDKSQSDSSKKKLTPKGKKTINKQGRGQVKQTAPKAQSDPAELFSRKLHGLE